MKPAAIRETLATLFEHVEILDPSTEKEALETARDTVGEHNENDLVVLATAIALDGALWSDDGDFASVESVPIYTTGDVIEVYEERFPG